MKTFFQLTVIFTLSLFAINGYSQINLHWANFYNGTTNTNDEGKSSVTDNSGNVYVTGSSNNSGTFQDYTTFKYSPTGAMIWSANYNGPANDFDQSFFITLDNTGNVIVTGYTTGVLSNADITTIKYSPDGVRLWLSTYNGNGNFKDFPTSVKTDQAGNVYVSGQSYGGALTNYDMVVLKYSPSGAQLWASLYNGSGNGNDIANSLEVDPSGNVYVTGSGLETETGTFDYVTLKYNSSGVREWVSKYSGTSTGIDIANDLVLDNSGNVYITGSSYSIFYDFATIKYNNAGQEQWVSRYNGVTNGNDNANSIQLDAAGNVFVAGVSRISGSFTDYAIIKYDNSGIRQWLRTYNGAGNQQDSITSSALDINGDIIVTGYITGSGTGKDIATIKYNSSGVMDWITVYNGIDNRDEVAYSVSVNNEDEVFVTGKVNTINSMDNLLTIKYSKISGIQLNGNIINTDFILYDNYPNPFNPSTQISFNLPVYSDVKLKVFDIKGNLVETIINSKLETGYHQVSFNASGISSGLYFYKLEAGNFVQTKKMVFVK